MDTGGLSPSDDGVAMDSAARMDELSRMLGESSGDGQHAMSMGQGAGSGGAPGGDGTMVVSDLNMKAEPALGAAALERVVAAAKAAHEEQQRSAEDQRAVCDLCNVRRADLRGPCGHKYHARCIYSMPITRCPVCDMEFGHDDGLFILPVEPYSAGMLFDEDDHRKGRDAEHQTRLRTGRWHSYETMYAQRIVADFDAGTMPLSEGTKLGNFLCNILNCSPSRLSKKLKIGKKYFQRCADRPMGEEHIAKHREAQKRLSDLEEMFLMAESQTNRGVANTQILSECIQKEWRERFIGHAHAVNQKLKNAWDWNSSRRRAELSSDALNKLLSSITPNKTDSGVNHLPPLFLVSHNNNGDGQGNNNGGTGAAAGGAGSGGGAGQGQGMQNVAFAQAMGNVLQSWQQQGQHGMQGFPSASTSGGLGAAGGASSSSRQAFPSAMVKRGQGSGEDFAGKPPSGLSWLDQQSAQGGQRHGQGHGGPGAPPEAMDDIEGFGDDLWSSLENNLASLGYQNSVAIEDMDQDPLTSSNPPGQWGGSGGQGGGGGHGGPLGENPSGPPSAFDDGQLFIGGMGGPNSGSNSNPNGGPGVANLRDAGRGSGNRPAWQPSPGNGGNMGGGGGNGNGGGGNGPGGPGGPGGGGGGGGGPGGPGGPSGGGGGPGGGGGGGGGGGSGGNDGGGGNGDDEDDEGSHRFEDFIGTFLEQIPFEAVDVWVPLCNQHQEGGEVVLFHAGYFTNVKELEEWGDYSTNFSFRQGQGLPGRVYGSNKSEWQENVSNLNHSHFLRLNGARNIGIRTSFGVPVVSRWGVTFVIVFYSRATVQLDTDMKMFIERTVSAWKFDATVDTDACQGDAAPATNKPPGIRP
eukprot:g10200.t2